LRVTLAGRRAVRRNRRRGSAARARPHRGHDIEGVSDRVGSQLIVGPPADEVGPCVGGVALDGEVHLAQSSDCIKEFLVAEGNPGVRVRLGGYAESHRLRYLSQAYEPGTQAQPGLDLRRRLRRQGKVQCG
jgi:hypothetical protein